MATRKPTPAAAAAASPRHTPGPWTVNDGGSRVLDADGRIVADTGYRFRETDAQEVEIANALLISATPDLLAALQGFVARGCLHMGCACDVSTNKGIPGHHSALCISARAAIAKATGEGR